MTLTLMIKILLKINPLSDSDKPNTHLKLLEEEGKRDLRLINGLYRYFLFSVTGKTGAQSVVAFYIGGLTINFCG